MNAIAGWNPEQISPADGNGWSMLLIALANRDASNEDETVQRDFVRCHYRLVAILRRMGSGPMPERVSDQLVITRLITRYLTLADVDDRDLLMIAARFGCQELAESQCRKILSDSARSASSVTTALMTASAIGMPEREIDGWLKRCRSDHRVSHVWRSDMAPNVTYKVQVRDIALALHLHRAGVDPRQRGFEALVADPVLVYRAYSLGFPDDAQRQRSHDSW